MAILGVKIKPIWRAGSRVGIGPGKCFMSHITPKCMGQHYLGPFLPSPGIYPGQCGVQNVAIYGVKHRPFWWDASRLWSLPGNSFMYHITLHYMGKHG